MKVRVKDAEDLPGGFFGFFGERRLYPGQEFEIKPINKKVKGKTVKRTEQEQFSESWMIKLGGEKASKAKNPEPESSESE